MAKKKTKGASPLERREPTMACPPSRPVEIMSDSPPRTLWPALLIIALSCLFAYSNNLDGEFIFDDYPAIIDNQDIRSLGNVWALLRPPPDGSPLAGRPVPTVLMAVNYAWGGLDVQGYHVVNNVIHLLASLALFGLVRSTLLLPRFASRYGAQSAGYALAVALIWALHPLQTEAVSYVTQRTETVMGLCYLATLLFASCGFRAPQPGRWYMASVAACSLGMASKEVMVSAPILVWIYDRLFVTGSWCTPLRRHQGFYGCLAATWAIVIFYQWNSPRSTSVLFDAEALSVADYFQTQLTIVLHYLKLAFWPHPLVLDGQDWPIVRGLTPALLTAAGILSALLGLTVWGLARGAWWSILGVWFFAILAPSSSVIPIVTEIFTERRMYLPLAAVVVLMVLSADAGWRRLRERLPFAEPWRHLAPQVLVGALALVLAAATWDRNRDYRTEVSIWQDTVMKRPGNSRAHENLGKALVKQGRFAEAISPLQEALRLSTEAAADPELYSNLGAAFSQLGRFDEAIDMHQKALALRPNDALDHYHLGNSLLRKNDLQQAALAFKRSVELGPDFAPAHGNLGMVLMQLGDLAGAEQELQALATMAPDTPSAPAMLADLRVRQGRFAEAAGLYRAALRLAPEYPEVARHLQDLLAAHPEVR